MILKNNNFIPNKVTNLLAEYKRPYMPKRGNSNCQFEVISQCLLKFLRINNFLMNSKFLIFKKYLINK